MVLLRGDSVLNHLKIYTFMLLNTTLRRKKYQIKRLNVKYVVNVHLKFLKNASFCPQNHSIT